MPLTVSSTAVPLEFYQHQMGANHVNASAIRNPAGNLAAIRSLGQSVQKHERKALDKTDLEGD
jgi:hypothetical protein